MSEANGVLRNHYHPPGATIYIEKRLTNQSYRLFSQPLNRIYEFQRSSRQTVLFNFCKLDIFLSAFSKFLIFLSNFKSSFSIVNFTLTSSYDSFKIRFARAFSIFNDSVSSSKITGKDVYKSLIVAAFTSKFSFSLSIFAVNYVYNCKVVLSLFNA